MKAKKEKNKKHVKWKEFNICDKLVWDKIEHGKRLKSEDRISGEVEYYSASQKNNSLTDFISNPLYIAENCILYNTFGMAFYVKGKFTASDEIYYFHNDKLNENNALFITTIMNKNRYKFKFGRKAFKNKFENETIILPVDSNGLPDWDYMEKVIVELKEQIIFKKINTKNKSEKVVIVNEWKEFSIFDLFDIGGVGSISRKEISEYGVGEYPYITRTEKNNGIGGFFNYQKAKGDVLTIETTLSGLCFYHDYDFSTGDHIMVLRPKNDVRLNRYTAMFIKTIWRKNAYKYGYNRPAIKENIIKTKLLLPSKNNKPDWDYMEKFIKKVPYGDLI